MIKEMTIDDFYAVSTTLRENMSMYQLNTASEQFAQDKEIPFPEAKAIILVSYTIIIDGSIKYLLAAKAQRIKELQTLGHEV